MEEWIMMNDETKQVVGQRILVANSFFRRLKGLMFQKSFGEYDGLLLTQTKQIHMFWMRFPLDVVYLKRIGKKEEDWIFQIVDLHENMKPWTMGKWVSQATDVLEVKAGWIREQKIRKGNLLRVNKLS
ncbi:DUF192 domain-containing protein [Tepidibacillus fermentans]|uniref:DUF192 domain-containing protein n=1 Tax=Tepidibacillus fermentans TaxID=1281767 RepID=A0A4R3KIF1_9BACI|nr:DUF192 domain-containing protein [Tepidibacillus fermentans]TCS83330.1 hypothetical protein EDD72_10570 [Tepidibacillus fermentans]